MVLVSLLCTASAIALGIPLVHQLHAHRTVQPDPAQTPTPAVSPRPAVPPVAPPLPLPQRPPASLPTTVPPPPAAPPVRATATPQVKTAHESKPQPATPQQSPDELLASALDSFDHSDTAKALSLARLAAERGAGAQAFVLISGCLYVKKNYAGAKEALEHALRLSPNNVEAKSGLEKIRRKMLDDTP